MEREFCAGICPHCEGNGLLLVVKDQGTQKLKLCCDECYQEFDDPNNVSIKSGYLSKDFNNISVTLEEAVEYGWADYLYVLEDVGKWVKYTDREKTLF